MSKTINSTYINCLVGSQPFVLCFVGETWLMAIWPVCVWLQQNLP